MEFVKSVYDESTDEDSEMSTEEVEDNGNGNNPWDVKNLNDFCFFICPECNHTEKDSIAFRNHALQSHKKARLFLKDSLIEEKLEPLNDFGNNLGWSYNWEGELDAESDIGEADVLDDGVEERLGREGRKQEQ